MGCGGGGGGGVGVGNTEAAARIVGSARRGLCASRRPKPTHQGVDSSATPRPGQVRVTCCHKGCHRRRDRQEQGR